MQPCPASAYDESFDAPQPRTIHRTSPSKCSCSGVNARWTPASIAPRKALTLPAIRPGTELHAPQLQLFGAAELLTCR
jgi:hypothetical protein